MVVFFPTHVRDTSVTNSRVSVLVYREIKLFVIIIHCYAGKLVTALVREFLDYFELEYTSSVFDPETNAVSFLSV